MLRAPLESFRSSQRVNLGVVPCLAIVCWGGGSNCGNMTCAHQPFMPGDPWFCHNDGTGVQRLSSCVFLTGNHPSLRVVIFRLLLLSHAFPGSSSFLSLLYVTILHSFSILCASLFPSMCVSPVLLCFFHTVLLSIHPLKLLPLRCVLLRLSAMLFFFSNSYQIYTLSHLYMPSQNGRVISTHFYFATLLLHLQVKSSIASLCECILHR